MVRQYFNCIQESTALMEDVMQRKTGNTERVIRIIVGLAMLSPAFTGPQSPLSFLGAIPLLTGLIG